MVISGVAGVLLGHLLHGFISCTTSCTSAATKSHERQSSFASLPLATEPGAIKGGMAVSGLYDLEPIRLNYMNPALGFTPEIVAEYSPVHLKPRAEAPLVFAVGGAETPEFQRHNEMLMGPWSQAGLACEEVTVPDLNHFTILENFSTEGRTLNTRMRQLMGLS